MLVVALIAILAAISTPHLMGARESAWKVDCDAYRRNVEGAEQVFHSREGRHSEDVRELLKTGVIERVHGCRAGGFHDWIPFPEGSKQYHRVYGCSVHFWPESFAAPTEPSDDEAPTPDVPTPDVPTPDAPTQPPGPEWVPDPADVPPADLPAGGSGGNCQLRVPR